MDQSFKGLIDKYICNPTAYNLHNAQGRGGGRRKGGGYVIVFDIKVGVDRM